MMSYSSRHKETLLTNHLVFPDVQRWLCSHSTIDPIRNPILSWVSSRIEIHLLLAKIKNQSLWTLNIREESHEKGLPEDADAKASKGFISFGGSYF